MPLKQKAFIFFFTFGWCWMLAHDDISYGSYNKKGEKGLSPSYFMRFKYTNYLAFVYLA